ncbi:MAG: DUF3135 domain-containing protein [Pseudomonadota bacterium]
MQSHPNLNPMQPDFDTLSALYKTDPQAFEELRLKLLNDAVNAAPARHRPALRQTLRQIEQARCDAATPMEATTMAFRLMCDSWAELHVAWTGLRHDLTALQAFIVIERARK